MCIIHQIHTGIKITKTKKHNVKINRILRGIENLNRKLNPLKSKAKFQDVTFVDQSCIGKRIVQAWKKSNIILIFFIFTLYESKDERESTAFLEELNHVSETFNMALLDSSCTKTFCGEAWLRHYIQSLSYEEHNQIETFESENILEIVKS